jgi:uncharacterized phiE125 gp8 family phage protein
LFDANAVTLTFWAGYGPDATNVPQVVKHAMLMLLAFWYERRQAVDSMSSSQSPYGVKALLDSAKWGSYR